MKSSIIVVLIAAGYLILSSWTVVSSALKSSSPTTIGETLQFTYKPMTNFSTTKTINGNIKGKTKRRKHPRRGLHKRIRNGPQKFLRNRKDHPVTIGETSSSGIGSIFSKIGSVLMKSMSIDNAIQNLGILKDLLINYGNNRYKRKLNFERKGTTEIAVTSRDGIAFPSIEGALLSLGFLVCAVTLIDLIQNLLSRLRVPNYNLPTAGPTGRRRSKTEEKKEEFLNFHNLASFILRAIENPLFH